MKAIVLLATAIACWVAPPPCRPSDGSGTRPVILDSTAVASLLEAPACLAAYVDSARTCVVKDLSVPSGGIMLSGRIYLPSGRGKWPVVILVPGGFNETDLIMLAPRYYAPRLGACGFAAYVFYKRGTGPSGGIYADATYDDFIDDVVNIARALARHPNIDSTRIGVQGGSSGAYIAAIAAVRSSRISFAISNSGPMVSWEEESNYNMEQALRVRGFPDSLIRTVMPLWRRDHAAWASGDTTAHKALAAEISELGKIYDPAMLPIPYQDLFADSSLAFMWPRWRSAQRDYLSELKHLKTRWLCIYGEKDEIVPVPSCLRTIQALMKESGNQVYTIIVLPGADHSFSNPRTGAQVPIIRIMVNWLDRSLPRP